MSNTSEIEQLRQAWAKWAEKEKWEGPVKNRVVSGSLVGLSAVVGSGNNTGFYGGGGNFSGGGGGYGGYGYATSNGVKWTIS